MNKPHLFTIIGITSFILTACATPNTSNSPEYYEDPYLFMDQSRYDEKSGQIIPDRMKLEE